MLFAALGIVALGATIFLIAFTSKNNGTVSVAAAMRAAGCTYREVPITIPKGQNTHLPALDSKVKWLTNPPAGGRHYGQAAIWSFYRDPVSPKMLVHNEEHGGAIIWWGRNVSSSTVDKINAFYNSRPNSLIGTPAEAIDGKSLGSKVAITAWTGDPTKYGRNGYYGFGHAAVCPTFDEGAFKTFRDAYYGKGPEGSPTSSNDPGMGG